MAQKRKTAQSVLVLNNKYTAQFKSTPGWSSDKPSLTEPGEAMTIKDIIAKYTRGDIPPMAVNAFHGYDIDMDEYDGTPLGDLTELDELRSAEYNDRTYAAQDEAKKSRSAAERSTAKSSAEEEKAERGSARSGEEPQEPEKPPVL